MVEPRVKPSHLAVVATDADGETKTMATPALAVATVLGRTDDGVLIDLDGAQLVARIATADRVEDAVGQQVTLGFANGDPFRPLVTGLLRPPSIPVAPRTIEIDAERLCLTAERELVLRCGKGSIRLTHDGHVVVDGEHLVSHSKGANRIRGATINLN